MTTDEAAALTIEHAVKRIVAEPEWLHFPYALFAARVVDPYVDALFAVEAVYADGE